MEIANFLVSVIAYIADPVTLGGGALIGFLFHKDSPKWAWTLLLFVMPGIGSIYGSSEAHGSFYNGLAQFACTCVIAFSSYYIMELLTTRRQIS